MTKDVCKRCGKPADDREIVPVQSGGWYHRTPCYRLALDEAVLKDREEFEAMSYEERARRFG